MTNKVPPISVDDPNKRLQDIANTFLLEINGDGMEFNSNNIKSWKTKFYEMRKEIGGKFTFKKINDNTFHVWKIGL